MIQLVITSRGMLLNWREYPSVNIYYMHKGLVVWTTTTTAMLWQLKPAKMKKSRQADSSGGTGFISSREGTYTVHVNQMFLT